MKGDGINLMKKITNRILVILVVAAMVLALPLTVVADDPALEVPVVETEAPEAEVAEVDLPETLDADTPEDEYLEDEYSNDEYSNDEYLEEEYTDGDYLDALAMSDELDDRSGFSAEYQMLVALIGELIHLRDQINFAVHVATTVGPEGFPSEVWADFQDNLAIWNDLWYETTLIDGQNNVLATGFDEILQFAYTNWDSLSLPEQHGFLAIFASVHDFLAWSFDPLTGDFEEGFVNEFLYLLYHVCDWPGDENCACILCAECPECGLTLAMCQCVPPPPVVCEHCNQENCVCCVCTACLCEVCECRNTECCDFCRPTPPTPPGGGAPTPGPAVIAAPQTGDTVQASLPLAALVLSSSVLLGGGLLKKKSEQE